MQDHALFIFQKLYSSGFTSAFLYLSNYIEIRTIRNGGISPIFDLYAKIGVIPSLKIMIKDGSTSPRRLSWREILFMPFGCLLQASPLALFALFALLAGALLVIYNFTNISIPGLGGEPDFAHWAVTNGYTQMSDSKGHIWQFTYEFNTDSTFSGLVRHVSPIRTSGYPMLTHDILVTSGDYANQERVRTSVFNHHFYWSAKDRNSLNGKINLLHIMPLNEEIYKQLLAIRNKDMVVIKGREILKIDSVRRDGSLRGYWTDAGCNTILVESVEILPPAAPQK